MRWKRLSISAAVASVASLCGSVAATAQEMGSGSQTPLERRSSEALARAFESDAFWWKHTRQIEDPELPWLAAAARWIGNRIWDFFATLADLLGRLLRWLFGGMESPEFGEINSAPMLAWLLIIACVALILWKGRGLIGRWLRKASVENPPLPTEDPESLPDVVVLLEHAGQLLQAGQYAEAIRAAFLGLLAGLQNRGLLRYDRSRTNREYHRDLRESPELARLFLDAARPYERVWYGRRSVGRSEAERVLELCRLAIQPQGGNA